MKFLAYFFIVLVLCAFVPFGLYETRKVVRAGYVGYYFDTSPNYSSFTTGAFVNDLPYQSMEEVEIPASFLQALHKEEWLYPLAKLEGDAPRGEAMSMRLEGEDPPLWRLGHKSEFRAVDTGKPGRTGWIMYFINEGRLLKDEPEEDAVVIRKTFNFQKIRFKWDWRDKHPRIFVLGGMVIVLIVSCTYIGLAPFIKPRATKPRRRRQPKPPESSAAVREAEEIVRQIDEAALDEEAVAARCAKANDEWERRYGPEEAARRYTLLKELVIARRRS